LGKYQLVKKVGRKVPMLRFAKNFLLGILNSQHTPHKAIVSYLTSWPNICVIDVGANIGQFGLDIRRAGYKGPIYSFEPASECFSTLTKTTRRYQPWLAFKLGLGSAEGCATINISGNSGLSTSILRMLPVHLENFPESQKVAEEQIQISTVDRQIEDLNLAPSDVFLKIDVQGYESDVIHGALKSLSSIPFCYLEVSLKPLYEGEITFLSILNLLSASGHEVVDIHRGIRAKNGELLQLDVLTRLSNLG
jgi:FkbM family methyltransferase